MKKIRNYLHLSLILILAILAMDAYSEGTSGNGKNPSVFREFSKSKNLSRVINTTDPIKSGGGLLADDKAVYAYYVDNKGDNHGVVSFKATEPESPHLMYPSSNMVSAGAYANGYYYVNSIWTSVTGFIFTDSFDRIDLKTGERVKIKSFPEHVDSNPIYADMTFDYSTNTMYAVKSDNTVGDDWVPVYSSILMKINLNTGEHTEIGRITEVAMLTLACTYDGQLWGIGTTGGLYKINKTDCTKQLVGVTGYTPWYIQSMEFDHTTGILYWAAQTKERSFFTKINTTNASVTEIGDVPDLSQLLGLYVPFTVVKQGAPNNITNISATPGANGALSLTLSWTNPTTDPFGTPLTQLSGVRIYRNDVLIRNYATNSLGGNASWTDANVPADGTYRYKLIPYNSVGNGEIDTLSVYVGRDIPAKPINVLLRNNDTKGRLTWDDSPTGQNGGWYDRSTLRYKITRFPDNVILENEFQGNVYEDNTVNELNRYWYEVESFNALGGRHNTLSNKLVFGPAVQMPYFYDFENEKPFELWSMVDNNNDGKTWKREYMDNTWQGTYIAADVAGFDADDYMIAPPVRMEAGKKYRVIYDYRIMSLPWTESMKISISKEPTNDSQKQSVLVDRPGLNNVTYLTDNLYFIPEETCNYYVGFYCYSEYYKWRLKIDNVKIEEVPNTDLKALTIKGPKYPVLNLEATYIVGVENNGYTPINEFSVQLIDEQGNLLSVANVNAELLPSNRIDVEIKWIPKEIKDMIVKGKIVFSQDGDATNNITSSNVAIYVQPEFGDKLIDIGLKGRAENDMPFDFFWPGSVAQNIYYKDEMRNQPASISSVVYYNSFTQTITGKVQIYMTNTERQDLADGWVPESEFTLVFEGNVTFPAGQNEIKIDLQTPFVYNGTNLCVTTIYPYKQDYYGYYEHFYCTETPSRPNRALSASNLFGKFSFNDPIAPPTVTVHNFMADIMFSANQDGAALRGKIESEGVELEGVTIEIPELSIKCTSDENGNYELPFVLVGNHTIKVSKLGYYVATRPMNVVNDVDMTENFDLVKIPTYNVNAKVTDLDGNVINNASVKLNGYTQYTATTNENGEFTINGVYAMDSYLLTIEHSMFITYENEITVTNINLSLGNIKLYDKLNMPMIVNANQNDVGNIDVSWSEPKESIVFRYDSGVIYTEGGFNSNLPNSAMGSVFKKSATLNSVSWYQGNPNNRSKQYNIYVFEIGSTGWPTTKLLYSCKDIPAKANSWNTHRLTNLVEAPNGFMIAVGSNEGNIGIGLDSGMDQGYLFAEGVQYMTNNFVENGFFLLEHSAINYNLMIRATGFDIENSQSLVKATISDNRKASSEPIVTSNVTPELVADPYSQVNMSDSKAMLGYEVWRLLENNESDESKWTLLTNEVINTREFTDNDFTSLGQGVYKYAVKAVYSGSNKSMASISNPVSKQMLTNVTVKVDVNAAEITPVGAYVKLINTNNNPDYVYSGIVNESKEAEFKDVWKGIYKIEIQLDGCDQFEKNNVDLSTEQQYVVGPYTLKEKLVKPYNLTISDGQVPTTKILRWNDDVTIFDNFESHDDFKINSPGKYKWTYINEIVTDTYGFENCEWPNMGLSHAYIVFNPSRTNPPLEYTSIMPYSGDKFLGSFSIPTTANNFIISPELFFQEDFTIEFMAKSLTIQYGNERMRVGYSLTDNTKDSFTWLTTGNYVAVPDKWTKYSFTVPKNAKYVTVNCVSNDALLFMVDDLFVGIKKNSKSLTRYEVYLDGEYVEQTVNKEFEFRNLSNGKHIAGVKAIYTTGESEMSTIEFALPVGVDDVTAKNIRLYPNPASNKMFVDGDYSSLKIFDMLGKMVLSVDGGQKEIDISPLKQGTYIVRIDENIFNLTKK